MKYLAFFILLFGISLSNWASAQDSVVVKGKVVNKESGIPLHAANVVLVKNEDAITGSTTNDSGFYKIKVIPGQYKIKAAFVGYDFKTKPLQLKGNPATVNFKLEEAENVIRCFTGGYEPPLFRKDRFTQGEIITNEEIRRLPLSK